MLLRRSVDAFCRSNTPAGNFSVIGSSAVGENVIELSEETLITSMAATATVPALTSPHSAQMPQAPQAPQAPQPSLEAVMAGRPAINPTAPSRLDGVSLLRRSCGPMMK